MNDNASVITDTVPDADGVFRIWPGETAPGSEDWDWQEKTSPPPWPTPSLRYTRNVVVPTVTLHRPPSGKANGTAMIIAPGGAFHFLMVDHEGHEMARWLNGLGVTALVLKYRVGRTPDDDAKVPAWREDFARQRKPVTQTDLQPPEAGFTQAIREVGEADGRQAIRYVRDRAAEWGIAPHRIGIAGFSAGGGVAMGAAMQHDAQSRPDFAVGIYPAYRSSLSVPVCPPPLFLVASDEDSSVPPMSTSRLYEAWHKAGGPAELHVFGDGPHGFGMTRIGALSDVWPMLLASWLRARGLLDRGAL